MADVSDSNQNNTPDCSSTTLEVGTISLTDDESEANENDEKNAFQEDEFFHTLEWKEKKKHIFILSSAGKPVYSRHGNEDRLVTLCGVMQAIVSFVQDSKDSIHSIKAGSTVITFLQKGPILLVSVSRTNESVEQLNNQLLYVYNQVISVLTLTKLTTIFEQRRNYDLRRLLAGSERLIDHLIAFMESQPAFLLGAVKCLPLTSATRDAISQTIINCCSKIKNLVFAILIANNKLITVIKIKKYNLPPSDLHLIFNMVNSSESFKAAECWTPICLPTFEPSGFLHGHVSYLSEDCQACLLLLTTDRETDTVFFNLSQAKQCIVEKLRRNNCLEAINESMNKTSPGASELGIPNLRHFLYKSSSISQYWGPKLEAPYTTPEEKERLLQLYQNLYSTLHSTARNFKLLHQQLQTETMLGWITTGFELYITFDALVTKQNSINAVHKILRWMKKEEDRLFNLSSPTF